MPPEPAPIPRFVAEPPHAAPPHGRFADRLRAEFLVAVAELEGVDQPGVLSFFPDRTWHGHTYVPVTAATPNGYEVYGYVMFPVSTDDAEPSEFWSHADFTDETAERNPDWKLDVSDEVIGGWRGSGDEAASMTLIWGRSMISGGHVVTAQLGELTVDQCELAAERFTMIAPDDIDGELLEVRLYSSDDEELARESLYAEE